jgi:hypothetical protein
MSHTTSIKQMYNTKNHEDVDDVIAQDHFNNDIPFHVTHSPYYKKMVRNIVPTCISYVHPRKHKMRTSLLDKQETWTRKDCSIVMNRW